MVVKHSIVLLALLLLSSCGGEGDSIVVNSGADTVFPLPVQLRDIAAVNEDELILEVRVNEELVQVPRTDAGLWSGIVNVPANRTSVVRVNWSQTFVTPSASFDLPLADDQKVITVNSDARSVDFFLNSYNTDHDQDQDGLTNLEELEQGRSPVSRVDAFIGSDGAFPTGIPQPFSNECGTQIPVAVRVNHGGDPTAIDPPGDLNAWWCATYVTEQTDEAGNTIPLEGIVVFVNVLDDIYPITDSAIGRKFDDDSVEIFIDANNSKGFNYDGIDDYQLIFLADGDNTLPVLKGPRSLSNLQSDVQFTDAGYQLTVFIPRVEIGIQKGQPFGVGVEVNDDDDGGLRDGKYSWIGEKNVDRSWIQPRAFGTSQIPNG